MRGGILSKVEPVTKRLYLVWFVVSNKLNEDCRNRVNQREAVGNNHHRLIGGGAETMNS